MTAFRTWTDRFTEANAQVLGVSIDSFAVAGEFQDKLGLEFPLVSDFPWATVGKEFGVYNEQFGVESRVTVVVDKNGIVRDIYNEPRDFESHPTHALEVLERINAEG